MLVAAQCALAQTAPRPVAVIGGDANGGIQLENPRDIRVIGDRIIVLDANEPFLKLFDFTGKQLQRTVKKGGGPGEIVAVRTIVPDSAAHRVYLIDVASRRANAYSLKDTLLFETSLAVPSHVEDACVVGNHLFVMGMFGSHMIHELEPKNGQYDFVRSFAVARANPELDANPLFQNQISVGHLVCDVPRQRVVAVSAYAGVAQIVDLRTLAQRTLKLDGLGALWFKEETSGGRAGLTQGLPPGGFDNVSGASVTPDGVRLLADHFGPGNRPPEDFVSVSEWFVLANGTLRKGTVSRQREVGRSGNRVACFVGSPLPTIEIYQATRCP